MKTIFRDCAVWDGTGSAAYAGDVLVVGNRIAKILRSRGDLPVDGAQVIEAGGRTLRPGLV
jgi:N-acyl-D-aspartate/D-glutamate deacylase